MQNGLRISRRLGRGITGRPDVSEMLGCGGCIWRVSNFRIMSATIGNG